MKWIKKNPKTLYHDTEQIIVHNLNKLLQARDVQTNIIYFNLPYLCSYTFAHPKKTVKVFKHFLQKSVLKACTS